MFLCDFSLIIRNIDFASYTDETTSYITENNIDQMISVQQNTTASIIKWFSGRHLKKNRDKCYLLIFQRCKTKTKIVKNMIKKSKCEKLLAIIVDSDFTFKEI